MQATCVQSFTETGTARFHTGKENAAPRAPSSQKKAGPPKSTSRESPLPSAVLSLSPGLIRRAVRYEHELDAAVLLLRALLLRRFARPCRDARGVDALLAEVAFRQIRARRRQLGSLGLLGIGEAYDDQLGIRFVLQTQRNVVSHALAQIVKARGARLGVAAFAHLGRLRRRGRLLHIDIRRAVPLVAAFVGDTAFDGVAAGLQARGVKLRLRAVPADLAARSRIVVRQRQIVRATGRRRDRGALPRQDRTAIRSARDRRRVVRLFLHANVRRARGRASLSVVYLGIDRVTPRAEPRRVPARIGSGALQRAARCRIAIGQRKAVRAAAIDVPGYRVVRPRENP